MEDDDYEHPIQPIVKNWKRYKRPNAADISAFCATLPVEQVRQDAIRWGCMPTTEKCIWFRCNLNLWPLAFSATPTHI